MSTQIIYIAGKVTGLDREETIAKFGKAVQELHNLGYVTINPMEIVSNPDTTWQDAMILCIRAFLLCNAILLLPDARHSKGAQIEYQLAKDLGIRVYSHIDQIKAYASSN